MSAAPLTGEHGAIHILYSGYFGYRGVFCTVLDLFCCVTAFEHTVGDKDA